MSVHCFDVPAPGLGLLGEDNLMHVAAALCHHCHGERQYRTRHEGGSILGSLAHCSLATPTALAWMGVWAQRGLLTLSPGLNRSLQCTAGQARPPLPWAGACSSPSRLSPSVPRSRPCWCWDQPSPTAPVRAPCPNWAHAVRLFL